MDQNDEKLEDGDVEGEEEEGEEGEGDDNDDNESDDEESDDEEDDDEESDSDSDEDENDEELAENGEEVHHPQKVDDLLNEPKEAKANAKPKETKQKKKVMDELPKTTENLLALREGLIAEIEEHMMNRTFLDDGIEQEMNLTYDLAEGPMRTLKGSMNEVDLPNEVGYYEDLLFLSLMQSYDNNGSGNGRAGSVAGANGGQ